MPLFRSELLPFHPPRHRSRIGEGLARYGRGRDACTPHAAQHTASRRMRACAPGDAHAQAVASACHCEALNPLDATAASQMACAA